MQPKTPETAISSHLAVRRSGYAVLRKLTQAAHYAAPEAWADVGYPGPPQLTRPM